MKLLVMDNTVGKEAGAGVDLAYRAHSAGHTVRYWIPDHDGTGTHIPYGDGLVPKVTEWEPSMDWAELIVLTANDRYMDRLALYFGKGYPIFGANPRAAELELDRGKGQQVLADHGVKTLPYVVVDSVEEALAHVAKEGEPICIKPWGGTADKAMTCVAKDANEAVFTLLKWKERRLKGQLMLQKKAEGIEIGISGFFGPGGWNAALEESWEHKRFMNDDLGENTGEMGTVIRHTEKSKLFDNVLEPVSDYLHACNYVGDCSINCIVDSRGTPWPLEFTCRLGWPDFCIRQSVIKGDPITWMADLVYGQDSLEVRTSPAVGVVMGHGDLPRTYDPMGTWAGFPIEGISSENEDHLSYQQMMRTECPFLRGGKIVRQKCEATAGHYVMVVHRTASTVKRAADAAYRTVEEIRWPSNVMYRTDIGSRLKEELPVLQELGYAVGVEYV